MPQGDKLLRLPSHTYDTKDLVRNMSVAADGPEEIIEADEYLQPQLIVGVPLDPRNRHQVNGKLDKVRSTATGPCQVFWMTSTLFRLSSEID